MTTHLTSFSQEVILNTTPSVIYNCLMDSNLHSELTGGEADIENKVGGNFTVFDGYASGVNLELETDKKIVQTWIAEEVNWDKQYVSKITFLLERLNDNQTKIIFTHEDIPTIVANQFKDGWNEFYWIPLQEKFNN